MLFALGAGWLRCDVMPKPVQSGGAYGCVVVGCILKGNSAGTDGGGSIEGVLTNCVLVSNLAGQHGGGSYAEKLINCTVISNSVTGTNFGFCGGGIANS